MDNKNYQKMNDEVIDLKELICFILRKWRILILVGIIGVVLGCVGGLVIPEKGIEDLDMEELHLKEIEQYARYQELYNEQLRIEAESVYMNMDPESVYMGSKVYFLTAYDSDMIRINEMYNSIFRNERIAFDLIDASGLNCSELAIHELAWVDFSRYEREEKESIFGKRERSAMVSIGTVAPTEEACRGMLALLDERVQEINRLVESTYPNAKFEVLSDTCKVAYDSGVMSRRSESTGILSSYASQMRSLKENILTEDDMLYYSEVYEKEEEDFSLSWLKWGVIIGVLFGGIMVVVYGGMFLMDGCVKSIEELKKIYGLHLIACLNGRKKNNRCAIDRMLITKLQYNSEAYLRSALAATGANAIHVCGDMKNMQIAEQMKLLNGEDSLTLSDRLAVDEKAQQFAKVADGVVVYVQLWSTKRADLLRELEIASHINAKVLGVVVLD